MAYLDDLDRLENLHQRGIVSDDYFTHKKQELIDYWQAHTAPISDKEQSKALTWWMGFRFFGGHRFYLGQIAKGLLQLSAFLASLSATAVGLLFYWPWLAVLGALSGIALYVWLCFDGMWLVLGCHYDTNHLPVSQWGPSPDDRPASPYSALHTFVLCLFLGWLGMHRFYVRRYVSGLLQACLGLLTLSHFFLLFLSTQTQIIFSSVHMWATIALVVINFLWQWIDAIHLSHGHFNDQKGLVLSHWQERQPNDPYPSVKKLSTAILLCYFVGFTGAHYFYLQRTTMGTLQLLNTIFALFLIANHYWHIFPLSTPSYLYLIPSFFIMLIWNIIDQTILLWGRMHDAEGNFCHRWLA